MLFAIGIFIAGAVCGAITLFLICMLPGVAEMPPIRCERCGWQEGRERDGSSGKDCPKNETETRQPR